MSFDFGGQIGYAQQQNWLKKAFESQLLAQLGYLDVATQIVFPNKIGQTFTFTRPSPFVPTTTPLNPATVGSNLNNGMTPQYFNVEQYVMQLLTYASLASTDIVAEKVLIASEYLQNAENLGQQSRQSLDWLARNTLLQAYTGGQSYVTTTLGAPGTTIHVDNVVGFENVFVNAQLVPVSPTNTLPGVQVGNNLYTLVGTTRDGSNTSQFAAYGAWSGNLVFSTNVTVLDGTEWNSVISPVSTPVIRPAGKTASVDLVAGDYLTANMVIDAVTQLRKNAIKNANDFNGYVLIASPDAIDQLMKDPTVLQLYRTRMFSNELYSEVELGHALGCDIVITQDALINNIFTLGAPTSTLPTTQAIVCGRECLIKGDFDINPYEKEFQLNRIGQTLYHYQFSEFNIAHISRAPIDALGRYVAQTWEWIGGFVAPTDSTITSAIIPTATNSYYKRATVLEFSLK